MYENICTVNNTSTKKSNETEHTTLSRNFDFRFYIKILKVNLRDKSFYYNITIFPILYFHPMNYLQLEVYTSLSPSPISPISPILITDTGI